MFIFWYELNKAGKLSILEKKSIPAPKTKREILVKKPLFFYSGWAISN
jgi:hypothetical protein